MSQTRLFLGVTFTALALGLGGAACSSSSTDVAATVDAGTDSAVTPEDASDDMNIVTDTSVPDVQVDTGGIDGGLPTVSASILDFGPVNCGATGTAQSFIIDNPSTIPANWTASLAKGTSSAFTLSGGGSGSLVPGASIQITVTPKPVPTASSTSPNGLGDVVTLSVGAFQASVQLRETAHGAILGFSPGNVDFGNTPLAVGQVSSPFTVTNLGNSDANVTLTLTGDPTFTLGAGSTATLDATPGSTGSSVNFTPTALAPYTGQIAMTTGDTLCSPLPSNMPLTGTGSNGIVAVSPPSILFGNGGLVDCSTTATPGTVTITNAGAAPLNWSAALLRGTTVFTTTPASGQVPPGTFRTLSVVPKAIPAASPVTVDAFSDVLTITTDAIGDNPHNINLHQTAHGAILGRSASSVAFNSVPVGTTATQQIAYSNTGNVDINVAFQNAAPEFVQPTSVLVGAAGFANPLVSFTPSSKQTFTDIGTVTAVGSVALCGPLPANLALSGTGTSASIAAVPTVVNFGSVLCGTTASAGVTTIRINNSGPVTNFNAGLLKGAGSFFTVSSLAPGSDAGAGPTTIAAGGFVLLYVTPLPIPTFAPTSNGFFTDTLEVTTANGTADITLNETALGGVLAFNKASIAFTPPTISAGTSITSPVSITNSGNLSVSVSFAPTPSVFTTPLSVTSPSSASITAGTSLPINVTFTPAAAVTTYNGDWNMTVTGTMCAPLPAPDLTLSGTSK